MKLLHCLELAGALLCLAACGDTDSLGGHLEGASGSGGTTGSGGTGGTSGSAGSAGAPGGSAGAGSGSGGMPDEATLRMDPFVVGSGEEAFMCQTFANPFGAGDAYVREFESHMTPGSHHLVVNYLDPVFAVDGELRRCSGLQAPTGPFTTQSSDDRLVYPQGVAARLPGKAGLMLMSHYFNTEREPLTANVTVTLRRAQPENVQKVAFLQTLSYTDITVPPHETRTFHGGVQVAEGRAWDLIWLVPHMHGRGVNFVVKAGPGGEELLFETPEWEAPAHVIDPPYRLNAGDWLNYSCTFFNGTDTPLTFGESAARNEMCTLAFQYTSSDGAP